MSLFEPITMPTAGASSTSSSSNWRSTAGSATGVNSSVPLTT
jgi:hypothetical protein